MSLLIEGMKMSEPGEHILWLQVYHDGTASIIGQHRGYKGEPFKCIEVPTPHGRLIDADVLKDRIDEADAWVLGAIDRSPTVIEAEE